MINFNFFNENLILSPFSRNVKVILNIIFCDYFKSFLKKTTDFEMARLIYSFKLNLI